MSDPRRELGTLGERIAETFLSRRGLRIVARNYVTPVGELDLVMRDGKTLVFVEVKTIHASDIASPFDELRPAQQKRLLNASAFFVRRKHWEDKACRFDVVGVTVTESGEHTVEHIPNAFLPPR